MEKAFEEPQKNDSQKPNNLFTMLFGENSFLNKLFAKKPAAQSRPVQAAVVSETQTEPKKKSDRKIDIKKLAPIAAAMLGLIPMVL